MHPQKEECSEQIIKAHSIHKAGILARIAKEGKVMMLQTGDISEEEFPLDLVEEGNKKATTFRNFCQYHDKVLFQDIEDKKYEGTEKQNFLYAFRVFSMQAYKKRAGFEIYKEILGKYHNDPSAFLYLTSSLFGMNIALQELEQEEAIFKAAIVNSDYNCVETITLTLDYEVKFAVSTFLELNVDLNGARLNDHADEEERIKKLYFNAFPQDEKTYIILSWLKGDSTFFSELKQQLVNLNQKQLINFLNNVIPCHTEHFVLNPDLWHSHSSEEKKSFISTFTETILSEVINIDYLAETPYDLCKKF